MLACLVKMAPLYPASGERLDVRLCSVDDRRVTAMGGYRWEPAITKAPALGMQFWNGDFEQGTDAGKVTFTFNIAQAAKSYPNVKPAFWMGAIVELAIGSVGSAWPWRTRFRGRITNFSGETWPAVSVTAEVDLEPFNGDLLTETYAGTGDAEGGDDLKDQVKPLALGRPRNVQPVLINEIDSVYQFSAYGPIEAVEVLYERASAFPASSGNFADYAALVAADIDPGHWATCLAEGLVRLGAPQYGVITGDIRGHAIGGIAPRGAGALVEVMADIAGVAPANIASATLAALDDEGATNSDVMITEQVSFLEAARRVVLPCNWQVVVSNVGIFTVLKPAIVETAALTLHAQGQRAPLVTDVSESATSLPYKKTIMAAERCWRVHTFDEIATSATLVDRGDYNAATIYREGNIVTMPGGSRWEFISTTPQAGVTPGTNPAIWASLEGDATYSDGTPIDDLQPVEGGSDVTSSVEGSLAISISCDSSGVPLAGSIPRDFAYKLFRNGVDVTAASVWSLTVLSGTITAAIDAATGIVTISAISSDARVQVSAAYTTASAEVVTRSVEIVITRSIAAPTGPNVASGVINGGATGTTPLAISAVLQITVGDSGDVGLNANYAFTVATNNSSGAYAQWYKWNGSVYVALGSETASLFNALGTSEPGEGSCSFSDTGNTPASTQKYRLYARPSISTRSINFSGDVSASST